MSQSASLAIGETSVRQIDGLFSLNDLHTAAGGEAKHQPALFLRLDSTQALVAEISSTDSQSIPTKTVLGKGKQQGTYACRELVIAYAAWISAAFHLKVIRVFLAQQAPKPQAPRLPARNLLRGSVQDVRHVLAFNSGNVGLNIAIPHALYTRTPVNPGERVVLEFAPGVNPMTSTPIAIHAGEAA